MPNPVPQDFVPTAQADVTAPTPDTLRVQVGPNAFGANVGQALQGAGREITQDVLAKQALTNEMTANDMNTGAANKFTQAWSQFSRLQGNAAVNALPQFQQQLNGIYEDTIAQAPNAQVQAHLSASLRQLNDSYVRYGTSHADQQWQVAQNKSAQDAADMYSSQVALAVNYPDHMHDALDAGAANIRKLGEQQQLDPDTIDQNVRKFQSRSLQTAVEFQAQSDPEGAWDTLERERGGMDATSQLNVEAKLRPMLRQIQTQRETQARTDAVTGFMDHWTNGVAAGGLGGGAADGGEPVARLVSAIGGQESGNNSGIGPSIDGARGQMQIEPSTFRAYAQPGENIDVAGDNLKVGTRIINDLYQKTGGDPERVAVGYFSGEGNIAPSGSPTPWKQDTKDGNGKSVSSYVSDVTKRLGGSNGWSGDLSGTGGTSPGAPDFNAMRADAYHQFGGDRKTLSMALSTINEAHGQFQADTADTRWRLENDPVDSVRAKTDAALRGAYSGDLPRDDIYSVYPKQQADKIIGDFDVAQSIGQTLKGMRWDSADQFNQDAADLESGRGVKSDMLKVHAHAATGGPGAYGAEDDTGDAAFMKYRDQASAMVRQIAEQRGVALYKPETADPAAYVLDHPQVKSAYDGVKWDQTNQDGTIQGFSDYAAQSLAKQAYLGVPDSGQHVLTRGQATNLTQSLMQPGGDPKATMDNLQKQYGQYWPKAFGDMVRLGNLPGAYEALPNLDSMNAAVLAKGLQQGRPNAEGELGKGWDQVLPEDFQPEKIKTAIRGNADVSNLQQAWANSGSSKEQIAERTAGIETLAMSRVLYMGDSDPITNAVKGFTSQHEFLPGQPVLVPTGKTGAVQANAQVALDGLSADKVTVPKPFGDELAPKPDDYLAQIKSKPFWTGTTDGNGMMLRDWMRRPVLDNQGKPIVVKFDAPESFLTTPNETPVGMQMQVPR